MTTSVTVVKGDYGYYLNFTITDNNDVVYDLSGKFITLNVADPSSGTNLFSVSCTIVSAPDGTCRYLMTSANAFSSTGVYKAELSVTDSESSPTMVYTVPNIAIYVVNDLPAG